MECEVLRHLILAPSYYAGHFSLFLCPCVYVCHCHYAQILFDPWHKLGMSPSKPWKVILCVCASWFNSPYIPSSVSLRNAIFSAPGRTPDRKLNGLVYRYRCTVYDSLLRVISHKIGKTTWLLVNIMCLPPDIKTHKYTDQNSYYSLIIGIWPC